MSASHADIQKDPRLTDEGLKRRFAVEWVRRPEYAYPLIAEIIGTETPYLYHLGIACYSVWVDDPFVQQEMARIRSAQGESAKLPTKEGIALEILETTRTAKTVNERLAGYKLYTELMGLNPKGNMGSGVNLYTNKVLVVPDKGNEKQWSSGLVAQQAELVAEARAEIDGTAVPTQH